MATINDLGELGVLVVAAAGNEGVDLDESPRYPAAYHLINQITVGAMTPRKVLASFSNFGDSVHILAPGTEILSSVPGGYEVYQGTSMASPFVAGVAALLWGEFPNSSPAQIIEAIVSGANKRPTICCVASGGDVNAVLAYEHLLGSQQ